LATRGKACHIVARGKRQVGINSHDKSSACRQAPCPAVRVANQHRVFRTFSGKRLTATANQPILAPMSDLCRLIWCALIGLFRSRAALEAEILVLRHQLNVLRRKSPKRLAFGNMDRLFSPLVASTESEY